MSQSSTRRYIGFDGEGETRHTATCPGTRTPGCKCPHYYALLCWSLGPGLARGYAYNPDGIPTIDAIEFVADVLRQHKGYWAVMYSSSYDFNCWIRDLEKRRAEWYWDELPIRIGRYHVESNKRSFIIRSGKREMKVWDTWRFYQGSFVKALEKYLPDYDGLEEIRAEKKRRDVFSFAADFDSVLHYCFKEIDALVLLEQTRDQHLIDAGIGLTSQLNGAGSVAAKIMTKYKVAAHIPKPPNPRGKDYEAKRRTYREQWPQAVERAAYYAYSGGRIELWRYGLHKGPFYVYDIRSAYPRAMLDLPSLANGTWQRHKHLSGSPPFTVFRVRFDTSRLSRGYPFFQRTRDGSILYPAAVLGWYWKPEILAAQSSGFDFDIIDGWGFHPETNVKPFAFVQELFDKRAVLKQEGMMGAQEMLKLGLNSLYGKTAQTVGGDPDNPPANHQMGWAGYMTARTRAELQLAAHQKPNATCYIATDGIGSTEPLDLPLGTGLGEWECTVYSQALLVQAGIYFLWDGDNCIPKYRGFDNDAIQPEAIISAWRAGAESIKVPSTRFLTLGSSLSADSHWNDWCSWRTIGRELDLTGGDGKREAADRHAKPWQQLCDLVPVSHEGVTDSYPYTPKWREQERDKLDKVPLSVYEDEVMVA